jgi:hypothetical protein
MNKIGYTNMNIKNHANCCIVLQALKGIWVNIYDFLDAKAEGMQVRRFKSQRALAAYTVKSEKIYPKKKAKEGGPIKILLAHIF